MPGAGLLQAGAFADQLMPVAVSLLLQVKAGGVIATPETPLVGTVPQASVTGAELDELVVADELLLRAMLDELVVADELLLRAMLDELVVADELLFRAMLDELDGADELLPAQD